MKGFPNQVAELTKVSAAIRTAADLVDRGADPKDDGVFGEALVHAGVAGTGHKSKNVDEYLREQRKKPISNQSFRTTARGLRELFRLFNLVDDSGSRFKLTNLGLQAADFAGVDLSNEQTEFWRSVIRDMVHHGEGDSSHPYQVLLRLVARRPHISRAKCALALEARNDSPDELDRIVKLSDLNEEAILAQIGVTESNWNNAKKVLPKIAEQLGDVIRSPERTYTLAAAPGESEVKPEQADSIKQGVRDQPADTKKISRGSREVTAETIAIAGTIRDFSGYDASPSHADTQEGIQQRLERLQRHNILVRVVAKRLSQAGAKLYEDPFDVLAVFEKAGGIVIEVKTLDGSDADERDRVREALAQLLYYEAFAIGSVATDVQIFKVAFFETPINDAHREWLNSVSIGTLWLDNDSRICGDTLATHGMSEYIEELR